MRQLVVVLILIFSITGNVCALDLNDVNVLSVVPGKDHIEVKLQAKNRMTPAFYVGISNSDEDALRKISFVMTKMENKKIIELNVRFADGMSLPSRSGDYYFSDSMGEKVSFFGRLRIESFPESIRKNLDELKINGFDLSPR